MRSIPDLVRARITGQLSPAFIERIMLAVSEVNQCALCSYAHSRTALETGMSREEIQAMLSGSVTDVPADQLEAIMFAQHYAESRGAPSRRSWDRIVEVYGPAKAKGILGAMRAIMIGNAYGVPIGSFFNRLRGRPDPRCSLAYEAGIILSMPLVSVAASVHALIAGLTHSPMPTCRS